MALTTVEQLGNDMIDAAEDMSIVYAKARRILATYWDTEANTEVAAVASGTDLVPGTDFTKDQYGDAINLFQQIMNMLEGAAVFQAQWHVNVSVARTREPSI